MIHYNGKPSTRQFMKIFAQKAAKWWANHTGQNAYIFARPTDDGIGTEYTISRVAEDGYIQIIGPDKDAKATFQPSTALDSEATLDDVRLEILKRKHVGSISTADFNDAGMLCDRAASFYANDDTEGGDKLLDAAIVILEAMGQ